jgi:hypothetical protein
MVIVNGVERSRRSILWGSIPVFVCMAGGMKPISIH